VPALSLAEILDRTDALLPTIVVKREESEALRRMPTDLAAQMADAGLFQLMLPKSVGGQELSPLEAFEVVERVSMADGSAGWCSMIATGVSLIAAWLPPEVLRDMASNPAGLRGAGSLRPNG